MAYVISVCGAGGKTTLCKQKAYEYLHNKAKVCILTSTKMWNNVNIENVNLLQDCDFEEIIYFGNVIGEKIGPVSSSDYEKICQIFDYVIVESDGSHMMPIKIPYGNEPVIPYNADEIVVVMGSESVGREIGAVCQHFEKIENTDFDNDGKIIKYKTIVTNELIEKICKFYYIDRLKKEYENAKISYKTIDFAKSENYKKIKKIALVLCASGFSKRFGDENKLLTKINNKELYKLMIEKLLSSKNKLINIFNDKLSYKELNVDIAVVSQYSEIIDDNEYENDIIKIKNSNDNRGLSSSIKLGISKFSEYDAICFFNADMPKLPENEIAMFLYNSICSNSFISSMFTDTERNPAYLEKKCFTEALTIDNDNGLKIILNKYKMDSYKYFISEEYLYDIDTKEDLEKYNE